MQAELFTSHDRYAAARTIAVHITQTFKNLAPADGDVGLLAARNARYVAKRTLDRIRAGEITPEKAVQTMDNVLAILDKADVQVPKIEYNPMLGLDITGEQLELF